MISLMALGGSISYLSFRAENKFARIAFCGHFTTLGEMLKSPAIPFVGTSLRFSQAFLIVGGWWRWTQHYFVLCAEDDLRGRGDSFGSGAFRCRLWLPLHLWSAC